MHQSDTIKTVAGDAIEVRGLDPRKDLAKAARFATVGMHLDAHTRNPFESWAYGRCCACEEIARSTHLYGAYEHDRLVGFLMADVHGRPKPYERSRYARFFKVSRWFGDLLGGRDASDAYDDANRRMLAALDSVPQAEVTFFAVDPTLGGRGIGTKLLRAFERDFVGLRVFLYTDDGCNYPFYERRGFTRAGFERIEADAPGGGRLRLDCMLYVKQL